MKILMVVASKHLGNTLKVAIAMADVAPITIMDVDGANKINFNDYEIVGFGSGIYFGKHDKRIVKLVKNLSDNKSYTFVFSTSGVATFEKNNKQLVDVLQSKNKVVLGAFGCIALDKFFILRLSGGMNKDRPNADDYNNAQTFMQEVINKYNLEQR